jgi:diguanylate cyclase (GGDEF)-like protein
LTISFAGDSPCLKSNVLTFVVVNFARGFNFMIEYLALAAEVTAVLLIISVAYPSNNSGNTGLSSSAETKHIVTVKSLEPIQHSLQTLRLLAFDAASKQFSNHESVSSWNLSDTRRQIASSLSDLLPLVIEPNQDAITRLPVFDSLNRFLESTRPLQVQLDLSIQMSMIAVDNWSEMVNKHGAITCDRLLREVGNQLNSQLNVHGLIVRFSEHTFAVVVFGVPSRSAVELLDETRLSIAARPIVLSETEIATTVSIGTTEVMSEDFDQESHLVDGVWERLEELLTAAITSGGNQTRGEIGSTPVLDPVAIDSPADSESPQVRTEAQSASIDTAPVAVEAAASSNDIAAMFATQKSKPKATMAPAAPPEVQKSRPDIGSDGKASGDDIAAMFAAQKSKPKAAATEEATDTPKTMLVTAGDAKASGDDIAALFSAQKAKPKTSATAPLKKLSSSQPSSKSKKTTVDPKATESLDDKVSADDVASLFANAKKPIAAKVAEKPVPKPEPPAPPAKAVIEEVAEESLIASIDDINALFAAATKTKGKKVAT